MIKDLFSHLNNICVDKKDLDINSDDSKSYSPYMINRFLSMCNVYVPAVNEVNKYPDIPKATHSRLFCSLLLKRKRDIVKKYQYGRTR